MKKKVVSGGIWMYTLNFFRNGFNIIQTIILARLLTPEHFGLVGIATIAIATINLFSSTGFNKALIQRKHINDDFLNVAWTTYIIRGVAVFLILFFSAPLIAEFFKTTKAIPVVRVLALSFLFDGFRNIGVIYFLRNLEFHKRFFCEISGVLSNLIVTISLAFLLRNEWAIVWGMLSSNIVTTITSYIFHPYRPRLFFSLQTFKELFKYSRWVILSAFFSCIPIEVTKVVLTKLMGPVSLGIYVVALRFANLPQTMFNSVIQSVLFPYYAKFQDKRTQLKDKFLKALKLITFVCIPISGGLIVLAKPFITIFLGEKWLSAIIPTQILAFAILLDVINRSSIHLFQAYGKPVLAFRLAFFQLMTLVIFIVPLTIKFGIGGTALSYLISSMIGLAFCLRYLDRVLRLHVKDFKFAIFPSCSTMFLMVVIYCLSFVTSIEQTYVFFCVILLSPIIYFGLGTLVHKFTRYKTFNWNTDDYTNPETNIE